MSNQRPIIPPPELVQEWWDKVPGTFTSLVDETHLATQAAQWGADQELEACINYFHEYDTSWGENSELITGLRTARRPQPPSLKEQALSELNLTADPDGAELSRTQVELIRQALESL
jgi:hypothetical protein